MLHPYMSKAFSQGAKHQGEIADLRDRQSG
jgi:hypothetical protein